MPRELPGAGEGIGATLRDARRRLGLEVKEVEERTKIRARYLRALENEDWEALPAPAYVRGFLRTYARVLGLDGEMLADVYRRRHELEPEAGPPASEPVLTGRRRNERPPSRGPLIGAVAAAIVVLLLALGLLGGDDDGETMPARERSGKQAGGGNGAGKEPAPLERISVRVEAVTTVEVCLVPGDGDPLIDGQRLGAGTSERYSGHKRYRIDLSPGTVRLRAGGRRQRVEASEPVSYEADSRGLRATSYRGPDCP